MKYRPSEYVDTPHGNYTVWRYMAHWKLESIIQKSELYFPNATKLTDQYEVSIPDGGLRSYVKRTSSAVFDVRVILAGRVPGDRPIKVL